MEKSKIDVVIPLGLKVSRVEKDTAWLLAKYFHTTVYFQRPINTYHCKTPDFLINNIAYELKTPNSNKTRQVELRLLEAIKQARHIIINTNKSRALDKKVIEICKKFLEKHKDCEILVITKKKQVLTFGK